MDAVIELGHDESTKTTKFDEVEWFRKEVSKLQLRGAVTVVAADRSPPGTETGSEAALSISIFNIYFFCKKKSEPFFPEPRAW